MTFGTVRRRVVLVVSSAALAAMTLGGPSSGAATALPVVNVAPAKSLVDLQKVTVSASGFSPNVQVGTVECRPGALGQADCDLGTLVYTQSDQHGAFKLVRYVRRLIAVNAKKIDCGAAKGCILGAGNVANLKQANGRTIFFNPKIPPKVATVAVTPTTKLVDHQLVRVSGKGYPPSTSVYVSQCISHPPAGSGQVCDYATQHYVNVEADGTFTAKNVVLERRQVFFTRTGTHTIDCATAAATCNIQAAGSGLATSTSPTAPLTFDPKVAPVVASVQMSPTTPLADLGFVTLTGTGYTPGYAVTVQECAHTSGTVPACDYTTVRSVTADFHGGFTLSYAVRRKVTAFLSSSGATSVDCAVASGTCQLTIQGTQSQPANTLALTFDPGVPAVTPTITVTPNTGLSDNQSVTVSLNGFTPNQPVQIEECSAEAITEGGNFAYCDYTTVQTTSPVGPVSTQATFVVRAVLGGQGGLVDCTVRTGDCVLVALESGGYYGGGGITTPVAAASGPSLPNIAFAELSFSSP